MSTSAMYSFFTKTTVKFSVPDVDALGGCSEASWSAAPVRVPPGGQLLSAALLAMAFALVRRRPANHVSRFENN